MRGVRGRWRGLRVAAAALLLANGCAARQGHLTTKFVKPGTPSVKLDAPVHPPEGGLREYMQKVRTLQSKAVTKASMLPTLETQNPQLAKALLALAMNESAEQHTAVAVAYRNAGITDYAFRHFQRALTLDRCYAPAYDGMARLWRDWGRSDLALGDAYRALHCDGASPAIYNTMGTIMTALGQRANAEKAFRQAIALNPDAAFALNNLCYLQLEDGQTVEAEHSCAAAVAADPRLDEARNNLALVFIKMGDLKSAERHLSGAGSGSTEYNIGVLRLAEGRFSEAATAFDSAAAADPTLTIARRRATQARRAAMEQARGNDDQR